jgi:hypothetical protein
MQAIASKGLVENKLGFKPTNMIPCWKVGELGNLYKEKVMNSKKMWHLKTLLQH